MHSETDLIKPAIKILRSFNGQCSTTELKNELKKILPLDAYDLQKLPSAEFSRIDQIIRNLKSNHHLERLGLVVHTHNGFKLTPKACTISLEEIEELVVSIRQNNSKTNLLTTQQSIFTVIKELGFKFKNPREIGNIFRNSIEEFNPTNDVERLEVAELVITSYVEENPESIV